MLTSEDYSRRDDLLMQQVTAVMAAQTDTIKALSLGLDALRTSHDALREKLHAIETMLAENGARERARLDHVIEGQQRILQQQENFDTRLKSVENLSARVSGLENASRWVMGIAGTVLAAIIIFFLTNVFKVGIGPK